MANTCIQSEWLTELGQCLTCGGRGGWPGASANEVVLCSRCPGDGRDPARGSDWYMDLVLPAQLIH
jgi:hypothetical protein